MTSIRPSRPASSTRSRCSKGTNANEGRLFETDFFPSEVTAPSGTGPTIAAAGGPASFDLQVPNVLCATPQFTGTPATCSYLQEIQFFLETLVTAAPSTTGPTAPYTEAVVAASTTAQSEYPISNFHNFVPRTTSSIPGLNNNFDGGDADEALAQIFTDFVFACNGFDSNSDLSKRVRVFAYEFNDPNAPSTAGVPGPGSNGSGFTTASEHASELPYIFNLGADFTPAQATLAADMKTYWANFVKTGDPNSRGDLAIFVSLKAPRDQLPFWLPFNALDNQKIQALTPQGLLTPQGPHPFDTFGPSISALLGSRCSPSTTAMSRSNLDLNSNRRSTTQKAIDCKSLERPASRQGVFLGAPGVGRSTMTVIPTSLRRLMPLQEGARAVDGARLQLQRLLPGEHRDLGIRAERGDIDRSHQWMRVDVVR